MISVNPFSICCLLLLCLPLAVVFTTTSNTTVITSSSSPPPTPTLPTLATNDKSLFRLASRVNSYSHAPKRIAFLFLTTTPLPFSPLWELFFHPNHSQISHLFNIYIHAEPNSSYNSTPFSGVFTNRVIHSNPTQRFTPTLISAARRLLAHALLHDTTNSMFALLSPTCIPLHSFNFTYATLIRSNKSFIEILKDEPGATDRWAARGDDVMLPDVPFEDFRVGSQFFVLTRRHAKLVVRDKRLWMKFKLPCVRLDVCYPEEHYFPTLLSMRDPHGCVPATLTHVDWKGRSDGHPRTYEPSEVRPELISMLRRDRPRYGDEVSSTRNKSGLSWNQRHDPFLFARKFSPDCLQPLMNIANDIIFQD